MNIQPESDFTSVDEYITGELEGETRHEYINGITHTMSGASANHNLISLNIASAFKTAARPTTCQVFIADMKVHLSIAGKEIFYYPDILVSCDPNDTETYFRKSPCLIVEVLSPTTERIDRREKFLVYTSIKTLQDYILVSQEQQAVTLFRRTNDWKQESFKTNDTLILDCLNYELSVTQIYEDIQLMES